MVKDSNTEKEEVHIYWVWDSENDKEQAIRYGEQLLCEQRKQIREWLKEILPKSYMSSDVPEIILKEFDEMKL